MILAHFDPSADELMEVLSAFSTAGSRFEIEKLACVIADKVRRTEATTATVTTATKNTETKNTKTADLDTRTDPDRERYVDLLMEAYRVAYSVHAFERCEELLQLAVDCDPMAEPPRRALGLLMLEQQKFTEADAHFAWCCEQLPGDSKLEELRRECRRRAANQATRVRAASFSIPR
jgi:hypothetical protein